MNGYGSACIDILISNLSLDPRDSRADFAAFQFSLLVVKTFVVIVKITIVMILMISKITTIIMLIVIVIIMDQYQHLGNCPPTPPPQLNNSQLTTS